MSSSMRSSAPGVIRVSGFSAKTYGALPRLIARLFAAENPRFLSEAMSSTSGNSRRTISGVPSWDALSTSQMRAPRVGQLLRSDVRHTRSRSRDSYETMTTSS